MRITHKRQKGLKSNTEEKKQWIGIKRSMKQSQYLMRNNFPIVRA